VDGLTPGRTYEVAVWVTSGNVKSAQTIISDVTMGKYLVQVQ